MSPATQLIALCAAFHPVASVHSPSHGNGLISWQGAQPHRQLYQHSRRLGLSGLVRKTHKNPKAIKVYLQEGKDDVNNLHGNWPLGNQDLAAALQFAGYKYKLVMTEGGHSGQFGGVELPNALRWLWDDNAESDKRPVVETKPEWKPHVDAIASEKVPHGTVEDMPAFESKIFENTTRDWSVMCPLNTRKTNPPR